MFNVTFYTFAKKQNSTARPTGTGTTIQCKAKGPLDKLAPVLVLQLPLNAIPTYNYAVFDGRYYRINGWTNVGALWEVSMEIDALATWKTSIGNQTIYVYRSSYTYNGRIVDNLYPTIARYHRLTVNLPKMWALDGDTASTTQGGGTYIVGVVGDGHTRYYGFTAANLNAFLEQIFSPAYYTAVLGVFGATEYPEAKVAVNPLQYISGVKFLPCNTLAPGTAWALHYAGTVSSIKVGPVAVNATAWVYGKYESYNTTYFDLDISTTDFRHPQADDRGDYLQLDPFTSYEAVIPPWGIIRLDSSDLLDADYLRMRITVDLRSDSGVLTLSALHGSREVILCKSTAKVLLDCPLSQTVTPGASSLSILSGIAGAATSALSGNLVGAASTLHNTIGTAVAGNIPHLSVVGSQSSGAAMAGTPHLLVTHRYVADDDIDGRGHPLCAKRRISTIPGYIMGDPDEISLACSGPELATIRAAIANGFYWE